MSTAPGSTPQVIPTGSTFPIIGSGDAKILGFDQGLGRYVAEFEDGSRTTFSAASVIRRMERKGARWARGVDGEQV